MKKEKINEAEIQRKITETWRVLPAKTQEKFLKTEEDERRKELRQPVEEMEINKGL
jgi:hypothetical protein